MNFKQRQDAFKSAIQSYDWTPATKYSESFGVSNSAKVVEGGLYVCNVNLSNVPERHDKLILACLIRFPPEDEVYFAVYLEDGLAALRYRLTDMIERGRVLDAKYGRRSQPADEPEESDVPLVRDEPDERERADARIYTTSNNNAKCYIAGDGRLYLRNKGFWDSLKIELSDYLPAPSVEKIVFSVWPPAVSARRSLLAREFIGYLGALIGRERVHELTIWPDTSALGPEMCRMPPTIPVGEIERAVSDLGGWYPGGEVRRYHAAINFHSSKHFVILAGLSGTGKTRLAMQYAQAVHGLASSEDTDPLLIICPVRPEWTDPTGLTGYYDVLSNRYIVPPFLEAVLIATAHRESPVFVILDEMNLARVEYYLSDVLSCIETRKPLQLHSSSVPLEGSTGTSIPAALPLPPNLYITGTINVDETTNPVSDKVLDRAMVIDMSRVDLPGFFDSLTAREPALAASVDTLRPVLLTVQNLLMQNGQGFGYRVAEEVVRYHAFSAIHGTGESDSTIDELMVSKVLVKLRGTGRQRQLLDSLSKALPGLPASTQLLERLRCDLEEFGSFQAAR